MDVDLGRKAFSDGPLPAHRSWAELVGTGCELQQQLTLTAIAELS